MRKAVEFLDTIVFFVNWVGDNFLYNFQNTFSSVYRSSRPYAMLKEGRLYFIEFVIRLLSLVIVYPLLLASRFVPDMLKPRLFDSIAADFLIKLMIQAIVLNNHDPRSSGKEKLQVSDSGHGDTLVLDGRADLGRSLSHRPNYFFSKLVSNLYYFVISLACLRYYDWVYFSVLQSAGLLRPDYSELTNLIYGLDRSCGGEIKLSQSFFVDKQVGFQQRSVLESYANFRAFYRVMNAKPEKHSDFVMLKVLALLEQGSYLSKDKVFSELYSAGMIDRLRSDYPVLYQNFKNRLDAALDRSVGGGLQKNSRYSWPHG